MATAVSTTRVGSQNVATPGARATVDTSAAQSPALISGGVLAIIGPNLNGEPMKVLEFATLDAIQHALKGNGEGFIDLRLACEVAYNASSDEAIAGTPEKLLLVKTNRDTRGSAVLAGAVGDLIRVTSVDFGAYANKTSIKVSAGTNKGVAITIDSGDASQQPEHGDDIGGDKAVTVKVSNIPAAHLTIDNNGLRVKWSGSAIAGKSSEVTGAWPNGGTGQAYLKSANSGDVYQRVTLYGLDGAGNPLTGVVKLNGTSEVSPVDAHNTVLLFSAITGARMDGVHQGDVKISSGTAGDFTAGVAVTFTANITADVVGADVLSVQASANQDVGKQVQIIGYDDSANFANGTGLVSETVTLPAISGAVQTVRKFKAILKVRWASSTPQNSNVVIFDSTHSGGSPNLTLVSGQSPGYNHQRGLLDVAAAGVKNVGKMTITAASDTPPFVVVFRGLSDAGVSVADKLTAPGDTLHTFSRLDAIELGAYDSGETLDVEGTMLTLPQSANVQDLVNVAAADPNFAVVPYNLDRSIGELDLVSNADCYGGVLALYSAAHDVVDWINQNSVILTATPAGNPFSGLPLETSGPLYLTGATSANPTTQDYMDAIDLLRQAELNLIVVLTDDAGVHNHLAQHLAWAYQNNKDRQGFVGIVATSKSAIKSATLALNSEFIGASAQKLPCYDSNGVLRTYGPILQAVQMAGATAAAAIGEPLTWKYMNVPGEVTQDGWNPTDDGEELLRAGLCFYETVAGRGVRVVRSITTYQKRADRIRTEQSSWRSCLASKLDLTTFLAEKTVGKRRSKVNPQVTVGLARGRLKEQKDNGLIEDSASIIATQAGNETVVTYQVAPEEPNNFTTLRASVMS